MSDKIKSKDLSYDSSLPPFLQRLRAQHTGQGDPDRHERPTARPKKARDINDDDGPTVVDESGDILSKQEYEKLAINPQNQEGNADFRAQTSTNTETKALDIVRDSHESSDRLESERDRTTTNGAIQRKRKVAKVIGDEDDGDGIAAEGSSEKKGLKKLKKKTKVIKLAFDD